MSMRAPSRITTRQYLLFEEAAWTKHEYRGGHVFPLGDPYAPVDPAVVIGRRPEPPVARAGASDTHVTIVQNLVVLVRPHLGAGPCRLYSTGMRVETAAGDYLYPDLVATCDERCRQDPLIKRNPTLIIEVLSPSTEGYDRGEKFDAFAPAPPVFRRGRRGRTMINICDIKTGYPLGEYDQSNSACRPYPGAHGGNALPNPPGGN